MDKKFLQLEILEKPYSRDEWREVLKDYFGAKTLHTPPHAVNLPSNDIAIAALELGSLMTADDRIVGIYEVELNDSPNIERNRVGLRSLLRSIYKIDVDGALIVFKQKDKWRFSYVSEIRTENGKKETEPKRYTYLFGTGESCRTAADRFDKLKGKKIYLGDLYDAFSVEKLNREFFKYYREHYEKFWKYLANESQYAELLLDKRYEQNNPKREKPIRDFAKKLLGRIVFLQFLQRKGWMGVPTYKNSMEGGDARFIQTLFDKSKNKATFHSKELDILFFKTLNVKRDGDIVDKELGENIRVPFLNGGLFEKEYTDKHKIDFPVEYFEKLLDFFEQYNFTIDENDPYDSEVGIDPEMLGHIFENLLEDNRDKGAFYTPKEIVHYMCQESLIEYLHIQLPTLRKEDIELLVRNNKVSDEFTKQKVAVELNQKLKEVKICDPAIGSGAFPMGLLKEIFECRRLLYGYLRTQDAFDPAKIKKEIIQENIYGVDLENGAVDIARLRFWLALVVDEKVPQPLPNLDYKIMQGDSLLESFSGVDLSNLMDKSENDDSIIYVKDEQTMLFKEPEVRYLVIDEIEKDKFEDLIHLYFDFEDAAENKWNRPNLKFKTKAEVKQAINNIVEGKLKLHFLFEKNNIEKEENDLLDKIKGNEPAQYDTKAVLDKKSKNRIKLEEKLTLVNKKMEGLNNTLEQLSAWEKQNSERPYFLWHTYFKDVFDKGGFDIVIGNPPYVQLQKEGGRLANMYKDAKFYTFERTGDLYSLFYEKGVHLLKNSGILCYITSNKWMRANYGSSTRQFFVENTFPLQLIDFGSIQIFDTATVDTNILLLQNKPKSRKNEPKPTLAVRFNKDFILNDSPLDKYIKQNAYVLSGLNHNPWIVGEKDVFNIKETVEKQGVELKDWEISINYGIKTGLTEAYIIDEKTKEVIISEDPKSIEIIRPVLKGRDITSWYPHLEKQFIIFSHNGSKKSNIPPVNLEEQYSGAYNWLLKFEKKLRDRQDQGDNWYNLRNCAYLEDFEKPKIIYREITQNFDFCYDSGEILFIDTAWMMVGDYLKYLTVVFNSKLFKYCFRDNFTDLGSGGRRLKKVFFEKIPVKPITDEEEKPFARILDYLVAFKKEKSTDPSDEFMFVYFEQIANALVYEFYFSDEFKKAGLSVAEHVEKLPELDENSKDSILLQLRKAFIIAQKSDSPIRNAIETMTSIPQINLINNTVSI